MKGVKINLLKEIPDNISLKELNYYYQNYGFPIKRKENKVYLVIGQIIKDI